MIYNVCAQSPEWKNDKFFFKEKKKRADISEVRIQAGFLPIPSMISSVLRKEVLIQRQEVHSYLFHFYSACASRLVWTNETQNLKHKVLSLREQSALESFSWCYDEQVGDANDCRSECVLALML